MSPSGKTAAGAATEAEMDDSEITPASALLGRRISLFSSCRSRAPAENLTIAELLDAIRDGRWRTQVEQIRSAASKQDADKLKEQLPAAKFSGEFSGLKAEALVRHSGLLALDVDQVPAPAMKGLRVTLADDPHVLAVFQSPGGRGLKLVVPVAAHDAQSHQRSFDAAREHFYPLLPAGAVFDAQPRSVAGNCFVSFDPGLSQASEPRTTFAPAAGSDCATCSDSSIHHTEQGEEEKIPSHKTMGQSHIYGTPPDIGFPLAGAVDGFIWTDWAKRAPYRPGARNAAITERVPLLLNLVGPQNAAWLLLRWFDQAPGGMFAASRSDHWHETQAAIQGCLKGWATNKKVGLSAAEQEIYRSLHDDRQRDTFRICRSLSLTNDNKPARSFFLSDKQLGDRLGCDSRSAARQLEYLAKRTIVEVAEKGVEWEPGRKPKATRYRWLLK